MILLREWDHQISVAEALSRLAQRRPDEASERPIRGGPLATGRGGGRPRRGRQPAFSLLLVMNTLTTERRIEKVNYL